jgi:hypothetical protein
MEGVFPWKGVRMSNRKLCNIRPSWAFSPEMTSSNVTGRAKNNVLLLLLLLEDEEGGRRRGSHWV